MSLREIWHDITEWFEPECEEHADGSRTVTVKSGDYLSKIAQENKHPGFAEAIVAANPQKDWDAKRTIYPGEKLKLPANW